MTYAVKILRDNLFLCYLTISGSYRLPNYP